MRALALNLHESRRGLALGLLLGMLIGMTAWPSASAAVAEERLLRLEALEFSGQWKTREAVLRRIAALEPGTVLDADVLAAARERLLDSGYFHAVDFSSRPGGARGLVVVTVTVRERHRPYLDTGFGFRDPEGWYLTLLGLRAENPLGLGGRASAGVQLGFRSTGGVAEWLVPLRGDGALDLRLGLRAAEEQLLWYEQEVGWLGLYDEHRIKLKRREAELGLVMRPAEGLRLELGFGVANAEPEATATNRDLDVDVPAYRLPDRFRAEAGRGELGALRFGLRLGEGGMDGRPGRSLYLRGRWRAEAFGADHDALRLTLAARGTWALRGRHALALGLRAGWLGEEAPYYERFRLGGSYSLRGFRDHSLSPPEGHDAFATLSAEYRFPLVDALWRGGRLGGVLFADTGRGWLEGGASLTEPDIDYEDWQLGAGYGTRLSLPWLGVVGFDVGLPVTAGITGETVWYTLTLGHSF